MHVFQEQRHRQLEEKVRVLQTTKDELQSHCNQQAALVSELQSRNSGLTLEVENLKRRLEEMGHVSCFCNVLLVISSIHSTLTNQLPHFTFVL